MIFSHKDRWDECGVEREHHKFFILRWQEIFDDNTFDSWQVRFSSIISILDEIQTSGQVVVKVHSTHPNLDILIQEALQISNRDNVIIKSFPFVKDYLNKLNEVYVSKIKDKKEVDVENFLRLVNIISGNLGSYRECLIKDITEIIIEPPGKYKILLYSIIMSLGAFIKSSGYSISFLRESLETLKTPGIDFPIRFQNLIERFNGKKERYECRFFILPESLPGTEDAQIQFSTVRPNPAVMTREEIEFYEQDNQATIAVIGVDALDIFSARYEAEEQMERFFAKYFLYNPTKRATIKHRKSLITSSDGTKRCIGPDTSWLGYIRDFRKSDEKINELSRIQSRLKDEDKCQLAASLQYHKLALSASTDDAKMVNLWIALESLIQSGGPSAIDRICTYVSSSNSTGYVYRMMKALAISLNQIWRKSDTSQLGSKLKYSKRYLHPEDLLRIFLDKKDGELINLFYEIIKDNPLITYRIHHIRNDFFSDTTKLSDFLDNNRRNVDWQIRRIYRARNFVMHQGSCAPGSRQLIQNLHSYYIVTIHNLIYDLEKNPEWTINDALEHRYLLFNQLVHRLKNYKNKPFTLKALLNPQRLLTPYEDDEELPWTISNNEDE